MSLAGFFKSLGAPLRNTRWSQGAVRTDGTVFLRVWQDLCRTENGVAYADFTHRWHVPDEIATFGDKERLAHLELVKGGAPCFLIVCIVKDRTAQPREIKSFDNESLRRGGKLVQFGDDWYIELGERKPAVGEYA